jgi:predicted N-formylglutamate amidohydrolase
MNLAKQDKKNVGTWISVNKKLDTEEARKYNTLLQRKFHELFIITEHRSHAHGYVDGAKLMVHRFTPPLKN